MTHISAFSLPNPIANIGILVICDKAVPEVFGLGGPTWPGAIRYQEMVGISNISVKPKDCLLKAGSFGGWIMTKDGRKLGLTCAHYVPECDIGRSIVSPLARTVEITTRLQSIIIHYPKYTPQSRSGIGPSDSQKVELKSLRKMFTQVPD